MAILLLTGCSDVSASVPGLEQRPNALVQPATRSQIYAAPAALEHSRSEEATTVESANVDPETLIQQGKALYTTNCAPCHRANGEGNLNRFPALNGNALVTAQDPEGLIRTVLYGRGVMPSYMHALTEPEIAAVLSYIRNAWSNEAEVISAADLR